MYNCNYKLYKSHDFDPDLDDLEREIGQRFDRDRDREEEAA